MDNSSNSGAMYNYMDYLIAKDFSDLDRLEQMVGLVLKKFTDTHVVDRPVISPDFAIKYSDYPQKFEIPTTTNSPDQVLNQIIPLFKNCVNWGAPGAMFNITPPSNILGVAINLLTSLLNPNIAEDRSGGLTAFAEQQVVKCLGALVKWDPAKVTGMSCFGGKATNLYASRNALAHCRSVLKENFKMENAFYISSDRGHPCQTEGAELQGISKANNVVLPCEKDGKMNLKSLQEEIDKRLSNGQIFLGLTLNAGTTMEYIVDDIAEIVAIRDTAQEKYNLPYRPLIHADAVLGWVWLFADKIDEVVLHNKNISTDAIAKVKEMYRRVKDVALVDSIGVDFHKLGYTAYQSSFYISQSQGKSFVDEMKFSQLSTYRGTIELSRGAQGVMGALASLMSFGYEGYVNLVVNLMNSIEEIRDKLSHHPMLEVLDPQSLGICTIVTFTHKKPLVEEKLTAEDVKIINDMNEAFVRKLQKKLEMGETGLYFSFSKSYLAPGSKIRYGGLKMYGTSPHLSGTNLDAFLTDFLFNTEEFLSEYQIPKTTEEKRSESNAPHHPIF